jgi:hypothetical protein
MAEKSPIIQEEKKTFLRKYGGLLFISGIIVLFIVLALANINFGQWLADTIMWFYEEFGDVGIYIGV